jgi:hypothetical protein
MLLSRSPSGISLTLNALSFVAEESDGGSVHAAQLCEFVSSDFYISKFF